MSRIDYYPVSAGVENCHTVSTGFVKSFVLPIFLNEILVKEDSICEIMFIMGSRISIRYCASHTNSSVYIM